MVNLEARHSKRKGLGSARLSHGTFVVYCWLWDLICFVLCGMRGIYLSLLLGWFLLVGSMLESWYLCDLGILYLASVKFCACVFDFFGYG